jgi:hypothetical protein
MYIISLVLHRAVCLEAHVNGFKKKKKKKMGRGLDLLIMGVRQFQLLELVVVLLLLLVQLGRITLVSFVL